MKATSFLATAFATLLAPLVLRAGTWDGGLSKGNFTVNDLWSTPNNWVGAVPASGSTTDVTFVLSGIRTTATQNIANPFVLRSLVFAPGSNVTAVTGNQISVASGGTIAQNSSTAANIGAPIAWAGSGIVTGTGAAALTLSGTMSGVAVVQFTGAPGGAPMRINVNGASNYTGFSVIGSNAPGFAPVTVAIGSNTALGSAPVNFTNGNTLSASGGPRSIGNQVNFVTQTNGLPTVFTFGAGENLSLKGPVSLFSTPITLRVDNAVTTIDGNLNGSAAVTKTGAGKLVLTGSNASATGPWTIDGGSLELNGTSAFPVTSATVNTLNGLDTTGQSNVSITALTGTGSVVVGDNTVSIGALNQSSTFAGRITAPSVAFGTVRKVGTGTFTSTGTGHVFRGMVAEAGTFIQAGGTISLGNAGFTVGGTSAVGTAAISLGAQLTCGSDASNVLSGPPGTTMIVDGAGTQWTSGFQIVVAGGLGPGLSDGLLRLRNNASASGVFLLSGAGGVNGAGNLIIESGAKATYSAGVVGFSPGSVGRATVTGSGSEWIMPVSLGMGGFSTAQRGGTGTLTIADRGKVQVNGDTTFWAPGSRIEVHEGEFITNALATNATDDATVAVSDPDENTSALRIGQFGASSTYSGRITNGATGPGGLTVTGGGTVNLTGPLTYTGVTRVLSGRLIVAQPFPFATITQVSSGATLEFNGTWGTNTFSQTTVASGGTLTVTNSGTLRGNVTNFGTIDLSGARSLTTTGTFVNNGRMLIKSGASFSGTGTLVNNGIIDIITAGAFNPPPGFVNQGQIIDRNQIVTEILKSGSTVTVRSPRLFGGHLYVLQATSSLLSPFLDIGTPIFISTDQLVSFPVSDSSTQRFYRWKVD